MPWLPLHQTWQICWQIYPPIEHRCLEYQYTTLGISTGRCLEYHYTTHSKSIPHQLSKDALSTITPNLVYLLADALSTVTWNMADLPPPIKHRCLEDHYTKLGRSTPHLSIDHWISYREICNLVLIGNLVLRNMEIWRLYHYHFRSLFLSLSLNNSIDICCPRVEITLRHIRWQINWFLLLKLIEADSVADLTPPVDLPVHLNGHFWFLLLKLMQSSATSTPMRCSTLKTFYPWG